MQKIPALTSIRFIAAFAVFLEHWLLLGGIWLFYNKKTHAHDPFWGTINDSAPLSIIFELRYGVTLFFVLSGFLLGARYFHTIFRRSSFLEYWIKRFARIMPLYWTLLAIVLLHYAFSANPAIHARLKYWPAFVTMSQSFFEEAKWLGNETAWSLTVEEVFYLMLPFVILSFRWIWEMKKAAAWVRYLWTTGILIATSLAAYEVGLILHRQDAFTTFGFMRSLEDIRIYTLFGRFFDFGVGILLGMVYIQSKNPILKKGWLCDGAVLVSVAGILVMCLVIRRVGGVEQTAGWLLNGVNAVLSGVIIYTLCSPVSKLSRYLSWRPFVYLGEISYALYLVHKNSIVNGWYSGLMKWFEDQLKFGETTTIILSIFLLYGAFTLLSVLCYEVVERPCQHLILSRTIGRFGVRRPTLLRFLTGSRREGYQPARLRKKKESDGQ